MKGQAHHCVSAVGRGRSGCRDRSGLCQVNVSFSSVVEPQCDENAPQSLGTLDTSAPISKIDLNLRKSGAQILFWDALLFSKGSAHPPGPLRAKWPKEAQATVYIFSILTSEYLCHFLLHPAKVCPPSSRCCHPVYVRQTPRPDSCTCIAIHSQRLPFSIRTFFMKMEQYVLILKRCNGILNCDGAMNRSDRQAHRISDRRATFTKCLSVSEAREVDMCATRRLTHHTNPIQYTQF